MPNKSHGPLLEDYKRALKAAKWAGWKVVRVEIGGSSIALVQDDAYLQKLSQGIPSAPDAEGQKREPHNWKDW